MELTDAQKIIVEQDGNCVVLATPGSGKTFVISEKIRRILLGDELRDYQGVIAISYTRKAAKNLRIESLRIFHLAEVLSLVP